MDADAKKTALRMIPYGLYVLTAEKDGEIAAATVNWVTQTAFDPPLVVVGVKGDSTAHEIVKKAGCFALNILGKGQQGPGLCLLQGRLRKTAIRLTAKPTKPAAPAHRCWRVSRPMSSAPWSRRLRTATTRFSSARWLTRLSRSSPTGRADGATLIMAELGEKVFYGG